MKQLSLILIGMLSLLIVSCNNSAPEEKVEQVEQESTGRALPVEWTKNANIYEVNLRQYSKEGTFNEFARELPRLKEMGVDILWFMPIHPIGIENKKGSLGSYYAVRDYKAVGEEYGTFEDFKLLVDKAHKLGMHVLIDWVANHTSWDNVWVEKHSDYYEKDSTGNFISPFDWSDVISLNYDNKEMRIAMLDALKFWLVEANIDGYRCDVAGEVPTEFWEWVRPQLDEIKPVFMLAEAEKPELLKFAFDMDYGWEFHHIMNGIAKGDKNVQDILAYLKKETNPENSYKLNFITNHDENSWNGTIEERLGDAADVLSVLTYTLNGMPLMYSGQEAANEKRLEFFEKDIIDWKNYPKQEFLSKLMVIKHNNPALWNGNYGGKFISLNNEQDDRLLAFKQVKGENEILVLLNLSSEEISSSLQDINFEDYSQILMSDFDNLNSERDFIIGSWGYCILKKQ